MRCSKCRHDWYQAPETQEEDIPLSVMPRAQELDDEQQGGFDWRGWLEAFRKDKPREFAAALAATPFVVLSLLILLALVTGGQKFPSLPEGMSLENMEIALSHDKAVLRGLVINESMQDHAAPVFSLRSDDGAYALILRDSLNHAIPALSEVELSIPIDEWDEAIGPVTVYLEGFADPIKSQAQDMSADTHPVSEPVAEETHPSDEHHSQPEH